MYDKDTYVKSDKEEKSSVIDKEQNRMKLLPIFAVVLAVPPSFFGGIGYTASVAGIIGQTGYMLYSDYESLDYLFWKIGAVVCGVNYLCAFVCLVCSIILGLISLMIGMVSFIKYRKQLVEMILSACALVMNAFFIWIVLGISLLLIFIPGFLLFLSIPVIIPL